MCFYLFFSRIDKESIILWRWICWIFINASARIWRCIISICKHLEPTRVNCSCIILYTIFKLCAVPVHVLFPATHPSRNYCFWSIRVFNTNVVVYANDGLVESKIETNPPQSLKVENNRSLKFYF